jgi:hypothetical protein
MRLQVCVVPAVLAVAFVAAGGTPRPAAPDPRAAAGVGEPELLLDGSGHGDRLYPQFADFDADGKADLLIGVRDRLLVRRNVGTNQQPVYAKPAWFDDAEPSAVIPAG